MFEKEKYLFLKKIIKNENAIDELLAYTENKFIKKQRQNRLTLFVKLKN